VSIFVREDKRQTSMNIGHVQGCKSSFCSYRTSTNWWDVLSLGLNFPMLGLCQVMWKTWEIPFSDPA